jgi:phage gp29-like protein
MSRKPVLTEIARIEDSLWVYYQRYHDAPAQILRSESASSRPFSNLYDLYQEMEDKDGHLFSVLQTRKIGVLSRDRRLLPASNAPADLRVADFVQRVLAAIPNFDRALYNLLDAIAKGFSVLEILWEVSGGDVFVSRLKSRHQALFAFDPDGTLRLLNPPRDYLNSISASPAAAPARQPSPFWGVPLPEGKFIVFSFDPQNENPYGKGLCCRAYWYYWFKKNNLKFWVIYNEKFGSPTIIGKYSAGTSEEERQRLFDVIESLQTDTGVTVPQDVVIEFLEARRSGTINSYKDLADWCNDEISKIVLGQTLTTTEGRRSGSLALGRVHETVRHEYVEADARTLMDVINSQLIPYIVFYNFGPATPLPRFTIDTSRYDELDRELEIDRQLVNLGVPLPLSYFYDRYRRPTPLGGDRSLRYDDNNLYQYHLQFGVLTINEVRATLGLEPVAWGDQPPQIVAAPASQSKPQKTAAPRSVGADQKEKILDPTEESIPED